MSTPEEAITEFIRQVDAAVMKNASVLSAALSRKPTRVQIVIRWFRKLWR